MPKDDSPFRSEPGDPTKHHHDPVACPGCGQRQDGAMRPDTTTAPSDGDWSICVTCGEVSVYVVGALGVGLREASLEELVEFNSIPENVNAVRVLHQVWAASRPEQKDLPDDQRPKHDPGE